MDDLSVRRLTGLAGLAASVLTLIELPLYFVYADAPPQSNVLARTLFGIVGLTCLVVSMTGFRHLVVAARAGYEWVGALASAAGLMWVTVVFVSTGLETGAVIASPTPIDPTIAVPGTYILYGSISRLLEGLFLLAFGHAAVRTGALPRWAGRSAYLLALVNLAFVPSLFFGNVPANFYAANGWGTTATVGALGMIWLLAVSVAVLAGCRRHVAVAGTPGRGALSPGDQPGVSHPR
ncbi:hypothetical protein [Pseudonocardia acaciae]|uniref:hypothetical protein n=1 Tax=Pseudonocardia acaciae TaxID=551276 RepID=UPI0006876227|nr:hypothetical protein [Pseudonocardia acaciae]